jgi:hypothetical protein
MKYFEFALYSPKTLLLLGGGGGGGGKMSTQNISRVKFTSWEPSINVKNFRGLKC